MLFQVDYKSNQHNSKKKGDSRKEATCYLNQKSWSVYSPVFINVFV